MLSVVVLLKLVSYTHAQLFDPLPMPPILPDLASCSYVRMSDDAPALVLCCGQRHGNLVAPPECLTQCVLEYEEPDTTVKRWTCPGGANVTTADYAVPLPTNPPPSSTAPFKLVPPSTPAMIIVSPTLPQTTSGLTSPPPLQSTITPRPGTTTTRIVISTTVSPTSPKFQSPATTLQSSALTTSSPVTTAGAASQLGNGSNSQNTAAGATATTDQVTATSESDKVPSTIDGQSGATITTETSSCSPSKNVAGGIREIMVMLLASLAMVVVV
ncbi:hypothetical protein H257_06406 [Aphanomyces astaci]|uniref:Uncharacterized protein n=1 Tax=Aphanomyces astaci TaxID=112090 RepID=W4GQ08_APHAT|nr:hypothetical protein H257_06406 [Aphanomyces astaci]ETV80963.1 hypothetical protein H257_06406 [Aphanomyces astaci]|eukprot:XP_009829910.1 hypothetical protein H257_06406 [Aphanomyces astaci]